MGQPLSTAGTSPRHDDQGDSLEEVGLCHRQGRGIERRLEAIFELSN